MSAGAARERPVDVVLVGLGAAGAIAAELLSSAGLEVLALEAGPWRRAQEMSFDEIRNDSRSWLSEPKAAHELPTWRTDAAREATPAPWPLLMVNAVGGSTVHYPGLSARLHPWNFESRTRVLERYGPGVVPAASTMADWPLSYEQLEPYYEYVEQAIGVSGRAGNLDGAPVEGGDPFEGPRGRDYPMAPLRRSGWTELTAAAARGLGWHPFPAPAAVNSEPHDGRPACTYCGFCTNNGCHCAAKGSPDVNVIPRAQEAGLRIATGARVLRIEVDSSGRACGVSYVQGGRERFQPARAVLLGTFTYENTRLLLLSRSRAFPQGLANTSDQVGRHYIAHVTPFAYGLFPGRRLSLFNGLWAQATCVDDWNADNFDHGGLGFIGGGLCTASHELKPIAAAASIAPPRVGRWGAEWKAWLARNAQSVGVLNAQFDSLPYESNRLDLDPRARDPWGTPVVRVTHAVHENERRGYAFMLSRLERWLREAGADETWAPPRLVVEPRHCYGGTRMGEDPESSVVDPHGFAHDCPNLGVLGSSVFPSAGGHNPTLTVQALASRTAAHLLEAWGERAGEAGAAPLPPTSDRICDTISSGQTGIRKRGRT